MWTWLLILTPLVAIVVLVWNYRRQAAAREAASAERMKAFLGMNKADPNASPGGDPISAVPTPQVQAARGARNPSPALSGFAARAQLLNAEELAIYRLLKNALPECEVFPRMSLSAFIQPADNLSGFAREAQARQLVDATVDFLVCDITMKPRAAVRLRDPGAADASQFAQACVTTAGLRFIAMDKRALPNPDDVRARVLGG